MPESKGIDADEAGTGRATLATPKTVRRIRTQLPPAVGDRPRLQRAGDGRRGDPPDPGGRRPRRRRDHRRGRRLLGRHRQGAGRPGRLDRPGPHPPVNQGKGAAIRTGMAARPGRPPAHSGRRPRVRPRRLAQPARARSCGARPGSSTAAGSPGERKNMMPLHWIGNRFLSLVTNSSTRRPCRTWRPATSSSTARSSRADHRVGQVRLRAGDHRQGPAPGLPHLRGARSPMPAARSARARRSPGGTASAPCAP